MRLRYKWFVVLVVCALFAGCYCYITYIEGNRFSAEAALKARSTIGEKASIFGQVDLPWGYVFLVHTDEGDRTAIVRKHGLLWFCNYVTTFDHLHDADSVRTVGWLNYQYTGVNPSEQAALIAVVTTDPEVKTIEVGEGADRVQRTIEPNTPLIIWWPKQLGAVDWKPVALSSNGTPLYEYRFAQANFTDNATLKWYRIGEQNR